MGKFVHTKKELAAELNVSKGRVTGMAGQPWFPPMDPEKGFDVDAITAAWSANVRRRPRLTDGLARKAKVSKHDPNILILLKEDADPVSLAQARVNLAAVALAKAAISGSAGREDHDALADAQEELRVTKSAEMKLLVSRGELIRIDDAIAALGIFVQRLKSVQSNIINQLPAQVETWHENSTLWALKPDERARVINAWPDDLFRALNESDLREIKSMLATETALPAEAAPAAVKPEG